MVFCAAVAAGAYRIGSAADPAAAGAQDVISLDRRISTLEQRLYSIESSISQLRQQMIVSQRTSPTQAARDPEIGLLRTEVGSLRSQVEILKARLSELECGLVRLDERTLSAAAKETRTRAGAQSKDSCRLNPQAPVQLSSRPR
jgi:hypothetical protein